MEKNTAVGNFIAMCERASQIVHEKLESLQIATVLAAFIVIFDEKLARLKAVGGERSRREKSPAMAKAEDKNTIEGMRYILADGLRLHATATKDIALKHRVAEYSNKKNFRTDSTLKANFKLLVEDARANAKELQVYNVSENDLLLAEALEAALPKIVNQTKVAIGQRKGKTAERDRVMEEIRDFFENSLNPAVRGLRDEAFAELYNNVRKLPQKSGAPVIENPDPAPAVDSPASGQKSATPPTDTTNEAGLPQQVPTAATKRKPATPPATENPEIG